MAPLAVKTEAEAEGEEAADYGDALAQDQPGADAAQAEMPVRAMPDYGDLIDDDPIAAESSACPGGAGGSQTSLPAPKTEPRPEAIHVAGVQRLSRGHLAELFTSKRLPMFHHLEWIADERVLCVFSKVVDAAAGLRGFRAGFGDAAVADDAMPGPGLWRGQRGMLDFREAVTADGPDPMFRKQHRGGRQVREFRFWAAIQDMDKQILEGETSKGQKRPLPSGEDAIAAAGYDDGSSVWDAPARKRRRAGHPGTEEEAIDLLEEMAKQDKEILSKEEDTAVPQASGGALADVKYEDDTRENDAWRENAGWWPKRGWPRDGGKGARRAWYHDDRGDDSAAQWPKNADRWGGWGKGPPTDSAGGWSRKKAAPRGSANATSSGWAVLGADTQASADADEQEKRTRRNERFRTAVKESPEDAGVAPAAMPAGKEEIPAPAPAPQAAR